MKRYIRTTNINNANNSKSNYHDDSDKRIAQQTRYYMKKYAKAMKVLAE